MQSSIWLHTECPFGQTYTAKSCPDWFKEIFVWIDQRTHQEPIICGSHQCRRCPYFVANEHKNFKIVITHCDFPTNIININTIMEQDSRIEALAKRFNLSDEFLTDLYNKVVDKNHFFRAVRMFVDGLMPYAIATGKEPINITELRHQVAKSLWEFRTSEQEKIRVALAQQKRIVDYYATCTLMKYPEKPRNGVQDGVFIKDGHIVAFLHKEHNQGGIYAANNEVMHDWHWNPHEHLGRIRSICKAFYRRVKKAAFNDPAEYFKFD
jgi:hypothetical protein